MRKQVLFIQGGSEAGYQADEALVASLKSALGKGYEVHYPEIKSDETLADFGWTKQISERIQQINEAFILVGHSLGASMILKGLSENSFTQKIEGIFLLSTPFWDGNEAWKAGLKLSNNFEDKLSVKVPMFLYHCKDDEQVPWSHFERYKQKLTQANFREIRSGGHQLHNDLTLIAKDIQSLGR